MTDDELSDVHIMHKHIVHRRKFHTFIYFKYNLIENTKHF